MNWRIFAAVIDLAFLIAASVAMLYFGYSTLEIVVAQAMLLVWGVWNYTDAMVRATVR